MEFVGNRRILRSVFGLAVVVLSTFVLAASAAAATTVGQAPPGAGASINCGPGIGLQLSVTSGTPYVVPPPGGVITRWRSSASGFIAMTVFRGSGAVWTAIAESPGVADGTLKQFDVRIPVVGGEQIGMRIPGPTPSCIYQTGVAGDQIGVAATAPIGSPTPFSPQPGYRFNIAVDVEPDADQDGYGDETQDGCPSVFSLQTACPPPPDLTPPNT